MFIRRSFQTLRGTFIFMISFGLLMGVVFPFYSYLFFGRPAFNPLYVVGCLGAGFMVGSVCYLIIKQVLRMSVERQCQSLSQIVGVDPAKLLDGGGDQLQAMMELQELLMKRVEALVTGITSNVGRLAPLYRQLDTASRQLAQGNQEQVAKVRETVGASEEMNNSFASMLADIEEIAGRADDRTSLCAEMSASTDSIAERIDQYSASVLETSASMEQMAASLKETSGNIEDLAISTEQTSSSVVEISASIAHVRDSAQKTADTSQRVRHQAREGLTAMASMLSAMQQIETGSRDSFRAIQRLAQHTAQIGSVLNIIGEIVEQTNLLSLNASIIAAQAGEKGRSFAVVAEEVRSLAQRTASSTKQISALVENIQRETAEVEKTIAHGAEKVSEGVNVSATTDAALRKIEESAEEASAMVQKIATGTMEQASGSNLIAQEAEKNLERVRQVRQAILEQEARTQHIVRALERMRELAQQINRATTEQAKGNRQYLESVVDDNEKARRLRETSVQQMILGDQVLTFIREAGTLIDANARSASDLIGDIEAATRLSAQLGKEIASFHNLSQREAGRS